MQRSPPPRKLEISMTVVDGDELQAALQDYISKYGIEALRASIAAHNNSSTGTTTPSNKLDAASLASTPHHKISPSYGRIQEELEIGGDAEAALRTANIQTTSPVALKEHGAIQGTRKSVPKKADLLRAALERRLGRPLMEVKRLAEQQKRRRALEDERAQTGLPPPLSTPSITARIGTTKSVVPPPNPIATVPFVDPPGFSLVKVIGLFFAVAPTQVALLDSTALGDAKLCIGVGVLGALNLLREVSKSPEFIIAATRKGETLSFTLLPDPKSSSLCSTDNTVITTRYYVVEDKIMSVESNSSSSDCISDYTWCLLKRVTSVIDREGEWRIGHGSAAATLRILYSNSTNVE